MTVLIGSAIPLIAHFNLEDRPMYLICLIQVYNLWHLQYLLECSKLNEEQGKQPPSSSRSQPTRQEKIMVAINFLPC